MVYNWRSPVHFAPDLNAAEANVKTLMFQGVNDNTTGYEGDGIDEGYDDYVIQPGAGCELANLMNPQPTNVYMTTATGFTIGGSPPDCTTYTALTWQPVAANPYSWRWPPHTFIEFLGVTHYNIVQNTHTWELFMMFVASLGWGAAPYNATTYTFATPNTLM